MPGKWAEDSLHAEEEDALLNAAVGVRAVMAGSYTEDQAVSMCATAQKTPGVPVVFDTEGGGKAQVTYIDGLGWTVGGTS